MKISYNWLGELVTLTLNPRELAERLTMAGLAVEAVEPAGDDHILDFDLTSNRPDALSHLGIAREAALVCGTSLAARSTSLVEGDEPVESAAGLTFSIRICAPDTLRGGSRVKGALSPKWLADRLNRRTTPG
jgi:phenylalanyl-tRNA synthetase beta chain